jgi:hypothetical protein
MVVVDFLVFPTLFAEYVNRLLVRKLMRGDIGENVGRSCNGDGFGYRFGGRGVQGAGVVAREYLLFPHDLVLADWNDGGMKDGAWM